MDNQALLSHANTVAPMFAVDPVIGSEFAEGKADNARAEVLRLVENWNGGRIEDLFEPASWALPA